MKLSRLRASFEPLISAVRSFVKKPAISTDKAPHIRDHYDVKRMMILVVIALIPCIIAAIWNTGVQSFIYNSKDYELYKSYLVASRSFTDYFHFTFAEGRQWTILALGAKAFLPIVLISYLVGGIWEVIFAVIRGKDIEEGFLVTGILYPLILPPTLPYWMVALGISFGIVIGKEIFGGTGMNILNPALTCRCFLYFAFPVYLTGQVWVAPASFDVTQSLNQMNKNQTEYDAVTQSSMLGFFQLPNEVKKIHVDAIAMGLNEKVDEEKKIEDQYQKWHQGKIDNITKAQNFVTTPIDKGGLGLSSDLFSQTLLFSKLRYGIDLYSNGNLFLGNRIGSMGEVSIFACLLGALFLLITGVASYRTMLGFALGMVVTASLFSLITYLAPHEGLLQPAIYDFPIYKHFLMGGAVFGLVFMATDPVSSPGLSLSQWCYGFLIGFMVIVIRLINPAYPEGVMLAILLGNIFAPLFDHIALLRFRKRRLYVS